MTLKALKALVKTLDYDMNCAGHENAEITFIHYDDDNEKVDIDYYDNNNDEAIRYTYSLNWERE